MARSLIQLLNEEITCMEGCLSNIEYQKEKNKKGYEHHKNLAEKLKKEISLLKRALKILKLRAGILNE